MQPVLVTQYIWLSAYRRETTLQCGDLKAMYYIVHLKLTGKLPIVDIGH